ncbi:hypothetical protein RALBFv3_03490 [Ralstonia solanacearum]|nr:hypothetical protein RALBFv3_03490 [Ralstonia solanacearum]
MGDSSDPQVELAACGFELLGCCVRRGSVQYRLDLQEIGIADVASTQAYCRDLKHFPINKKLLDLFKIDRRHSPSALRSTDESFRFQAKQRRSDRTPRCARLPLEPPLGKPFAWADFHVEDHATKPLLGLLHHRHSLPLIDSLRINP